MAATAIAFDALRLQVEKPALVRKGLQTIVLETPMSTPVPDLAIGFIDATDPSKLSIDLAVWQPYGTVGADGVSEKIKTSDEDAETFNDLEAPRSDIIGVERTLDIQLVDDHTKAYLKRKFGHELASVQSTDKQVAFDSPAIPAFAERRLLSITMDFANGDLTQPIFDINLYTRAKQMELPSNEVKKKGYGEASITHKLFKDSTVGTYCRRWIGGKGYDLTTFGF